MRRNLLLIIALLSCVLVQGQRKSGPYPPVFKKVSINPENGKVDLYWEASPSPPDSILGYLIYRYNYIDELGSSLGNLKIDSLPATAFMYTDNNPQSQNKQLSYTIASRGIDEPGAFAPPHSNVFLQLKYDSCARSMNLLWTHYRGWEVDHYKLYYSATENLSSFSPIATINGSDSLFVHMNVRENNPYNYYIKAFKKNDTITSNSNMVKKFTTMPQQPAYLRIDSLINLSDNQLSVYFSIDPVSELDAYVLKAQDVRSNKLTPVYEFSDKGQNHYLDKESYSHGMTVMYQLSAINLCNQVVRTSDLNNSLYLELENEQELNRLRWNAYKPASSRLIRYKIYRSLDGNFELLTELEGENAFEDDLSPLEYKEHQNRFCYYVDAEEYTDLGEMHSLSRSSTVCVLIKPKIELPTAIALNSPGNDAFEPRASFKTDYRLVIFNRWGNRVFVGNNEAWRGMDENGNPVNAGTYIYLLTIIGEDDFEYEYKGSISVFY